jgi:hypothetical protein
VSRSFLASWRDAVADSPVSSTGKLVAHTLATWMNGNGRCFPSQREIARRASLGSDRSVLKATKELERAEFLKVIWSRGRGSHDYQATLPTSDGVRGPIVPNAAPNAPNLALHDTNLASGANESGESRESVALVAASHGAAACASCGVGGGLHATDCETRAVA